ncbi:MAG: D-glycero-beta-D-manno-heptose 1,7-bisphosphate 7-phosphatase [Desulfovibrio sp.]|jgi:D-glycero-D-manno-heptose 1,7-bisphosphate phosphatase|nr:D-glycero-beta-D-manno-heptose 1,7-bisphosphate 7-phosphatase [Desulfovibrio sp.]
MRKELTRAIFFDRDGTLNKDAGYVHSWEEWQWLSGAPEALALLGRHGYRLVVATNQSGLARGLYSDADVRRLHRQINKDLLRYRTGITAFYYCPHHPDFTGPCTCRKPQPGMLLRAAAELGIDLGQSWMIGDKIADVQAGLNAGCRPVLVRTGYGREAEQRLSADVPTENDLAAAAAYILRCGAKRTVTR